MYATLAQFVKLSPADQAKVTHLDLTVADDCEQSKADLFDALAVDWDYSSTGLIPNPELDQ